MNKMAMSRLCETAQVTFPHIHARIDFLYSQCLAFGGDREVRLHRCFEDREPYFATDAQMILVNWPVKSQRGTVPLLHMATVHKSSQFVVEATVDYDPDVDPDDLEAEMEAVGDFAKPRSMREHARLWPAREYQASVIGSLPHIFAVPCKAGEMQQHGEARRALDQRADRRAAKTENEVSLPMSRHRTIGRFGGALTDHDLRRDKTLAAPADARPWHPQHASCSQAGRQLAAQHSAALNEQSLIDGFVADAYRHVVREVDLQASGNLLRAPGPSPSPVLSRTMPAVLPRNGGTRDESAARGHDDAGKSLLHISAQRRVEFKLGRFGPTSRAIRMPLGSRRPKRNMSPALA